MESSGRAESKTVPEFAFWATFEGDIAGFALVKVLVATTVFISFLPTKMLKVEPRLENSARQLTASQQMKIFI